MSNISAASLSTTRPNAISALREIARAINTAPDLDTTLDLMARKTTEVMHVDSCTIYLLDPSGDTLRLRATTGLARSALGRATLQVGEGMTGYAIEQNKPVVAEHAQDHPHFKWVDDAEEKPFHSLLAVPLVIETRPIGALNVQTLLPRQFSPEEVEILSLIGDLAAGAIGKAQRYDRQVRQLRELNTLAQVSEAVTSPIYLDEMLDVVTEMAATTMNAAVCSIFLLDESDEYLTLRSAKRKTSPYRHRPPLAMGEGIIGRVATSGQSQYVRDVRAEARYLTPELARDEGLVSLLSVPLRVRDRVIGVLNCYTSEEREFGEEQIALFSTLANQTALAIENANLVTSAAIVREMHHRIKNNLQTVAMLMQLQIGESGRADPRDILRTSIHRIQSIATVHEVLSERGFRLVDVVDVWERIAQATLQAMTPPNLDIKIDVQGEALQLPSRAATALTLVINELVQNAIEHAFVGRESGEIQISVGHAPEDLLIFVRDDGVGINATPIQGVGLDIVETLIRDDLRGKLSFQPLKNGTEVSIRIPREVEHDLE